MIEPERIYADFWDVNSRLESLGLDQEVLVESGLAGFSALAACTENHPAGSPGFYAWSETVRTLREKLITRAWHRSSDSGLSLVVNGDDTIAISVSSGDDDTGVRDGNPRTKYAKGPRTVEVVRANRFMDYLLPEMALPSKASVTGDGRTTWIFLIRCNGDSQLFVSELSRPVGVTDDGFVDGWAERIILATTRFGGDDSTLRGAPDGNTPQTPVINVEIKKIA